MGIGSSEMPEHEQRLHMIGFAIIVVLSSFFGYYVGPLLTDAIGQAENNQLGGIIGLSVGFIFWCALAITSIRSYEHFYVTKDINTTQLRRCIG